MSAALPELGSKISLISKADIRYEGRLFTVDPIECTIALAKVRSYGTEDRETQYPILPQNQVYDYILFRGTDIKDIRVINSVSIPNDPAIMQMHLPANTQQFVQQQPPSFLTNMGHPMNQQYGGIYNTMANLTGANLPPVASPLNKSKQSSELNIVHPESSSTIQLLDQDVSGGSRSTTPTSLSRKSPTHDMATQANQSNIVGRDNSRRTPRNRSQQRDRKDSSKNEGPQEGERRNQQQRGNQQYRGSNRNWVQNNRGNNQRGMRSRGRVPQQAEREFPQTLQNKGRSKSSIKYEVEYDFEGALEKFKDLCSKVDKMKVTEDNPPELNGGEVDKKDDSGNETGHGEQEVEEEDVTVGYDKTKSFFDNISCEAATDRAKGKGKDWRQERKINSETFGVSAKRGGFYNYRGRGFYNRSAMSSGGYRGNASYNRGGNYRGRNYNNRSYNSTSTGIPQQNKTEQSSVAAVEAAANN